MRRYLLVDDNAAVRRHLATALQSDSSRIVECVETDRIQPAVELLGRERFDAVFTSLGLAGGESGLDLLVAIAQRWPEMHTVVHTSRPEQDLVVREAMSQGAFAYLPKPLRALDLKRVLRELARGHEGAGSIP